MSGENSPTATVHSEPRLSVFLSSFIRSFGTFCSTSLVQRFSLPKPQNEMNKCIFLNERKKNCTLYCFINCLHAVDPPRSACLASARPIAMASSLLTSIQNYHLFHSAKQQLKSNCLWFEPPWLLQLGTVPVFSLLQSCYYSNATEKTKPQPVLNV